MTTGKLQEQNLEKQLQKHMGCMAGFLQLFDRHHLLTGKRIYSAKRLPSSAASDALSELENSYTTSPAMSMELAKPKQPIPVAAPSPETLKQPPSAAVEEVLPPKSPLPFPVFDLKENGTKSSWKFCKEAPRLSLDSRATTDSKGTLHPRQIRTNNLSADTSSGGAANESNRSPSVIARLMGLDQLPTSSIPEADTKPQLRRSASESRVSRDLFQSRVVTENHKQPTNQPRPIISTNVMQEPVKKMFDDSNQMEQMNLHSFRNGYEDSSSRFSSRNGGVNANSPRWKAPHQHRRNFFDSGDIFPEPKQNSVTIYGEIEKRLKMRGIDEPCKDLETLKHILEALQLKGLLHSGKSSAEQDHRNFVYDDSRVVVTRPNRSSSPIQSPINRQGNESRRNVVRSVSPTTPRREQASPSRNPAKVARSLSPPSRAESNANGRRSNALVKPKPLTVETRRRLNESTQNRRISPVNSPKMESSRCNRTVNNRSPRSGKPTSEVYRKVKNNNVAVAEDESSSISESSISTSTDNERSKNEEYNKGGRNLLERCDKLLHSIAEMTATDLQPSPVSVLDSSVFETSSPSPITTKRSIDFKDQSGEFDEELWSPVMSPIQSKREEASNDFDFVYISDILRASHYLPEDSDIFLLLEKQQYLKGNDTSQASKLERKLIFDTITEILDRQRHLPPWKAVSSNRSLEKIWSEFQRIRDRENGEDLFEIICGVLRKDLSQDAINGWGDSPVEMSESVLDIERLIFKDLIGETIRDLATSASSKMTLSRRKLVF